MLDCFFCLKATINVVVEKIENFRFGNGRKTIFLHPSGPSNSKHYSAALETGESKTFCFSKVLLLFYLATQRNDKTSAQIEFLRHFMLPPPVNTSNLV